MKPKFPKSRFFFWFGVGLIVVLTALIPVRIAVTFHQLPTPQGIFVLGGAVERMEFAGKFWQSRRDLDIWVSDFDWNLEANRRVFKQFGVPDSQLHLDGRATDTVTNFTSLVDDFVADNLHHVYLITSDYHMLRSRVIATIVFGSRGVVVTPLGVVSSGDEDESLVRVVRDFGRCLLWVVSGRTGASLNPRFREHNV
ncbi:YdcF family protein [Calothrix sp. NIES-3974]|uniref:YdcF family protein n=1 Tax=Calothrix sp. NIES-3974 TaxID=2005462 RepID=UPI000B5DD02C|nr:YdcF family protein [Calothrix sp. NIES-3974]BAZ05124.1 hypothetical protein NIES3974_17700 [Calothrix sp. NIES-3974]